MIGFAFLDRIINKGSVRSLKIKKNIIQMLFYKGGLIIIGFALVPITLNYVDADSYGLWLTLSSMVGWMSFFDIGINNGLKNKLTQALADEDYSKAKKYVSTTYAMLAIIFLPLMLILLLVAPAIDWCTMLNIASSNGNEILIVVCILIAYFCLNFILSTINIVIIADQRPADASLRTLIQQALSLFIIWGLSLVTHGSLIHLCVALCIAPLLVVIFFNFTLFKGRYKHISPSISFVDFSLAPDLMKLGIQFFIIQIAAIIQYQMISFLILRYYGATDVTCYNIAFNYFKVLTMFWGILTTPIWAAVTNAITLGDYNWISDMEKKYISLYFLISILGMIMLLISPFVYRVWIGDVVNISITLSFIVLLYNLTMMFGGIFVNIVNGSGKLKTQMIASLISPFVFFLVFYICNSILNLGIVSVFVAAIISNFNGLVLAPIQCMSIINNGKRKKLI